MPLLVGSMGCEMVYIIYQRLTAQQADAQRCSQVIHELLRSMFASEEFLVALFQPHKMASAGAMFSVFASMLQQSIIRLDANSMSKLFDLMMMGVKMQLVLSTELAAPLTLVQEHVRGVRDILAELPEGTSNAALDTFEQRIVSLYGALPPGTWLSLRQTLLGFFEDHRVKVFAVRLHLFHVQTLNAALHVMAHIGFVWCACHDDTTSLSVQVSLFMHEGLQDDITQFYLRAPCCADSTPLGTVTTLDKGGAVKQSFLHDVAAKRLGPNEWHCHPCHPGSNLYACASLGCSLMRTHW
jgi:Organic solute transport protein 1